MELPRTIQIIEEGLRQGLHVGAQLYVSLRGQVVADLAAGLARPARDGRPAVQMTPDTITLWLSSGKPLTAVAVAQLWERGLLDLDDAVVKFIPEFAANGKDTITLRHLLTHTAPLRLLDTGWPAASWDEIIARIAAMRPEPRWVPGRTAGYSAHLTWFLLGEILRRISGQSAELYVRDHVLRPCGMTNSYLAMSEDEYRANEHRLAVMQVTEKGEPTDLGADTVEAATRPRPSGSARGPARELGRFYEMMLNHGHAPASSEISNFKSQILTPQTVEAMTARHRVNTIDKTFNAVMDWGLGFMINSSIYGNPSTPYQFGPHASPRTFGHSGNQSSAAFADPEHGLAVALVFNGLPGEPRHQERIRSALTALYEDLDLANT
jgi:CubicO group peptidase (beta-lactamase class C family)